MGLFGKFELLIGVWACLVRAIDRSADLFGKFELLIGVWAGLVSSSH